MNPALLSSQVPAPDIPLVMVGGVLSPWCPSLVSWLCLLLFLNVHAVLLVLCCAVCGKWSERRQMNREVMLNGAESLKV